MASQISFVLFILPVLISPVYLQNFCGTANFSDANANANYTISVTPSGYAANTSYNVSISGPANVTSLTTYVTVVENVTQVGSITWLNVNMTQNASCVTTATNINYTIYNTTSQSFPFSFNWTSSATIGNSANLSVVLNVSNTYILLTSVLQKASTTTISPTTSNTTTATVPASTTKSSAVCFHGISDFLILFHIAVLLLTINQSIL